MDTQSMSPPINLVEDFQALHKTVLEDQAGDKTRRVVEYFRQAEAHSREMELHTQDYERKEFARMLHEAFGASSRIVLAAWKKAHGAELAV